MKRYFIKQKLIGLCLLLITLIVALIDENHEATVGVIFIPLGLYLIFSKNRLITTKTYKDEEF